MIKGKRIIVTGGASGMGAAMVTGYAREGARVVSMDVDPTGADVVGGIGANNACFQPCDVTDESAVVAGVASAVEWLGGLDVLVHAAAICPTTVAEDIDLATFEKVMTINVTGTFLMNRAVFPYLRDNGGKIINFASGMGVMGAPRNAHYAASKGAVITWTKSLALAWGRHGITVNAIAPAIWTPMYEQARAAMSPQQLQDHDAQQRQRRPILGQLGDAERDFMPMMIFLAGDGANYMTGQLFKIDGGGVMG